MGYKFPRNSVGGKEAYDIDRQSGTDFWTKETAKEMANLLIAFDKLKGVTPDETRKKIRPGYEHVNVHMIFYINMDGKFNIKERFVADGHTKPPP